MKILKNIILTYFPVLCIFIIEFLPLLLSVITNNYWWMLGFLISWLPSLAIFIAIMEINKYFEKNDIPSNWPKAY